MSAKSPLFSPKFPAAIYDAAGSRELDRVAIEVQGIKGYALMCSAAAASWQLLKQLYPKARRLLVICGPGNNGGDGYVLARLALNQGYGVDVLALASPDDLSGDAAIAYDEFAAVDGASVCWWEPTLNGDDLPACDVVVDALFGTGLSRPVNTAAAALIRAINSRDEPVLSLDIPSGLAADTGQPLGVAIVADDTITFIGSKLGLHTGFAPQYTGGLWFAGLGVPKSVHKQVAPVAHKMTKATLRLALPPRDKASHKGSHGHVLLIGGDHGMGGAIRMAVEAALRSGAGKVSVATRAEHVAAIITASPEAMPFAVDNGEDLAAALSSVDVVAIGPGLGLSPWGRSLWAAVQHCQQPLVVDADALTLLVEEGGKAGALAAKTPAEPHNSGQARLLTPHPGEAAALLGCSIESVQSDRRQAAERLQKLFGAAVVLKGNGSLVASDSSLALCPWGNPGMAVGGMGDVLTGIAAAMLAQGLSLTIAAETAVAVHALAADTAAKKQGERGLLPRDVIHRLQKWVNPK